MFGLFLTLLVVFFSMTILLWAGTLFIQGYLYSEPAEDLYWRAPAAAGAITLFFLFWCFVNYTAVEADALEVPYDTLFRFNPTETRDVDKLWSVTGETEREFVRRGAEFRDTTNQPWRREDSHGISEAIIIEVQEEKTRFEPVMVDGKFTTSGFPGYYQVDGAWTMEQLGTISVFRWGRFIFNLFLNALHFGLWFVCIWLLLRYQWSQALGLAVIVWVVVTLAVMPILLNQAMEAGRLRNPTVPENVAMATGLADAVILTL